MALHADDGRQSAGSNPFGTVSGGCSLAGWKFLNQNKRGVERGARSDRRRRERQLRRADRQRGIVHDSQIAEPVADAVAGLLLNPLQHRRRQNNNSAQLSIQYVYAGSGTPPTSVKIIFGTDPNDPTGGTASSLRTVVTGGSSADPLCINLLNPAATAVTNPNDCHATVWASTIGQLVKMINADPNYHAAIVGSSTNVLADALNPSQSGQDILTYCPAGATCPPYQAYPVSGTNLLFGYNCRVGGINTAFGTNRMFGNSSTMGEPYAARGLGRSQPELAEGLL